MWTNLFPIQIVRSFARTRRTRRPRLAFESLETRSLLTSYTYTDLGTLGVSYSDTADLNSSGQIVGYSSTVSAGDRAVLWDNGEMIDLGTLGGMHSIARAINDRGQVVGFAYHSDNSPGGFLINPEDTDGNGKVDRWFRDFNNDGANDLMIELPVFPVDINNGGKVVGSQAMGNDVLWTPTTPNGAAGILTDLGPIVAYALNDAGQIAGTTWAGEAIHAILWKDGLVTDLLSGARATAINASGQVTVNSYIDGQGRLWTPMTANGTVGTFTGLPGNYAADAVSYLSGVNDAGQVTGKLSYPPSVDGYEGVEYAFCWAGNEVQILFEMAASVAINNGGQIAGHIGTNWGATRAGLLTPVPSEPHIAILDVSIGEGNTGTRSATFTVTLSAASTQAVSVTYATSNGLATSGTDYQSASGILTIPAGQTSRTISVLVNGDRLGEQNETFFINLINATNATIADSQGICTIVDDEPRISISDVTKAEGKKGETTFYIFTVTLSAAYDQAVTLSFKTVNGTATTSNSDYVAKTGTLTFAPGETTKTITIEVKGDSKREANETFYLDLFGNSSNSLFTKKRGLGTILNDD